MNRPPQRCARASVLYVEDHPVNVLLMSALLHHRPALELVIATTGEQAMCIAANLRPTLLLLDLGLPDCHGSELLPLLRRLPGCEVVPAVAVTAEYDFEIEGSGFAELWPKPLDLQRVLQRMDTLIAAPTPSPSPLVGLPAEPACLEAAVAAAAAHASARQRLPQMSSR